MKIIIFCFISILSSQAVAMDSEREELSNYLRELNKIDRIFIAAKNNVIQGSGSRFKYKSFEEDLAKLKQELQVYLELPNRSPKILNQNIRTADENIKL